MIIRNMVYDDMTFPDMQKMANDAVGDGRKPIAIDLFCGCGGASLGLIQAGFDVKLGLDLDYTALHTYCANLAGEDVKWIGQLPPKRYLKKMERFPPYNDDDHGDWATPVKAVICDDIRKWHGLDILKVAGVDRCHLLVACPPCPSFSRLGKQEVGDPRDFLMLEAVRVILEIHPLTIFIENVPEVTKKKLPDGRLFMDIFKKILSEKDWALYYEMREMYIADWPDPVDVNLELRKSKRWF